VGGRGVAELNNSWHDQLRNEVYLHLHLVSTLVVPAVKVSRDHEVWCGAVLPATCTRSRERAPRTRWLRAKPACVGVCKRWPGCGRVRRSQRRTRGRNSPGEGIRMFTCVCDAARMGPDFALNTRSCATFAPRGIAGNVCTALETCSAMSTQTHETPTTTGCHQVVAIGVLGTCQPCACARKGRRCRQ